MQFKAILGQEEIKQRLISSVKENRVSHAQLFLSPDGSGALPLAIAYAQYINCEDQQTDDSCGNCPSCRKYERLIHPDLHFSYPFFAEDGKDIAINYLDTWRAMLKKSIYFDMELWRSYLNPKKSKQPNINIAECHDIIKKLSFKAFEAKTKVLILWLPEYLDKNGNSLLKIIEEPPANTLFLLIAKNQEQILSTILSRTQIIKIPRLEDGLIAQYLTDKANLATDQAQEFAFLADGNLVTAQQLLLDEPNNNFQVFTDWLRLAYANQVPKLIDFSELAAAWGREAQKNFIRYGIGFLRECGLLLNGADQLVKLPPQQRNAANDLANKVLTAAQLEALIEQLEKAHYHIERNANPKILFLDVSLQLVLIIKYKSIPQGIQHKYS